MRKESCCGLDAGVGSNGGNAGLDEDKRVDEVNDEGVEDHCGEEVDEIPIRATDPEPAKVCFLSNKGAKAAAHNKDDGDCAITSSTSNCISSLLGHLPSDGLWLKHQDLWFRKGYKEVTFKEDDFRFELMSSKLLEKIIEMVEVVAKAKGLPMRRRKKECRVAVEGVRDNMGVRDKLWWKFTNSGRLGSSMCVQCVCVAWSSNVCGGFRHPKPIWGRLNLLYVSLNIFGDV